MKPKYKIQQNTKQKNVGFVVVKRVNIKSLTVTKKKQQKNSGLVVCSSTRYIGVKHKPYTEQEKKTVSKALLKPISLL